jgi:hypothetical protein
MICPVSRKTATRSLTDDEKQAPVILYKPAAKPIELREIVKDVNPRSRRPIRDPYCQSEISGQKIRTRTRSIEGGSRASIYT